MELKKISSIECDSDKEIVECALYLIKNGQIISNFNDGEFVDFRHNIMIWKGLTKLGEKTWIRYSVLSTKSNTSFKKLLRKEKLDEIGR